jgi:hypothetical protein
MSRKTLFILVIAKLAPQNFQLLAKKAEIHCYNNISVSIMTHLYH